jgi:hypothetical protein
MCKKVKYLNLQLQQYRRDKIMLTEEEKLERLQNIKLKIENILKFKTRKKTISHSSISLN